MNPHRFKMYQPPLGMRDLTSTETSAFSECRVKLTGSNLRQVVPAAVTMGPIAVS